jgi:type I restriction enzyme R subunit
MFPGQYQSDFALQVTSDIPDAQQMAIAFANNNLRGHTAFREGYKSSKTRVCVTVGMMTTGYDCEDLLNLCLLRPIFSPTDFVQIKGRGTRSYTFKHRVRQDGADATIQEPKQAYTLFDFFANCEYFEEQYPYDEVLKLPPIRRAAAGAPPVASVPVQVDKTFIDVPDPLRTMEVMTFEGNVMRIDRELYISKFESKVKETYAHTPEFQEAVDSGNYEEMERVVKELIFNKPEEYFTLEKIRQGYQTDRRLGLWEILDKVFGRIPRFQTRDEIAAAAFQSFLVDAGMAPELYYEAREFFTSYLLDSDFRNTVDHRRFNEFAANPLMMQIIHRLGPEHLQRITEYIKDNIRLNQFT